MNSTRGARLLVSPPSASKKAQAEKESLEPQKTAKKSLSLLHKCEGETNKLLTQQII